MKRLYLLFVIVTLASFTCVAQRQNTYFLKSDGRLVESKDSADFIRIVSEPDSGSALYNVAEYYPKGQKKRFTKSSQIDPVLSLEGQCLEYFENGRRKTIAYYKKNVRYGEVYSYFPNGKLYTVEDYGTPDTIHKYEAEREKPLVKSCNDSTGKAVVGDGNGHYLIYDNKFKQVEEEGDVKDGRRAGEWRGTGDHEKIKFMEVYEAGKLINGHATDSAGLYTYTIREIQARYRGGPEAFGRYLASQIQYPKFAREHGIQGKVYLSFIIGKIGKVRDVKVLRSVSPEIDAESVRVISKSDDWVPGVFFGRQVSSYFTVPIVFVLGK